MVAGTSFLRAIAKEAAPVKALEIINLCQPSQVREFPYGQLELFHIAGQVIGRATYQPGGCWSPATCSRSRLATTAGWSATSHTPPSTCSAPTPTPSPPRAESSMRPREPEPASPNPLGPAPGQPVEVERRDQTGSPGRTRDQNSH